MPTPNTPTASQGPTDTERRLGRRQVERWYPDESGRGEDAEAEKHELGGPGRQAPGTGDHLAGGEFDHRGGQQRSGQQCDQRGDQAGGDVEIEAGPRQQEDHERHAERCSDRQQHLEPGRHTASGEQEGPGQAAESGSHYDPEPGAAEQDCEADGGEHLTDHRIDGPKGGGRVRIATI